MEAWASFDTFAAIASIPRSRYATGVGTNVKCRMPTIVDEINRCPSQSAELDPGQPGYRPVDI
uniref:Uncharacterized protein n=1 Tax=Paraburkholderia sprentiae WSM5005 TaxID=754502 RepID=A0A1I9YFW1_9BURK